MPQHRPCKSLNIHKMNTHTSSLMLKLMMSHNMVSVWRYFGEQLILQSCNAWIFLLACVVSLRDQLMSFSSQLVLPELHTQYTKDAIRGQVQKPQEEFCGSGKDRNLFSAQESSLPHIPSSGMYIQLLPHILYYTALMGVFPQQVQAGPLFTGNLWHSSCWVLGFFKLRKKLEVILKKQTKQTEVLWHSPTMTGTWFIRRVEAFQPTVPTFCY